MISFFCVFFFNNAVQHAAYKLGHSHTDTLSCKVKTITFYPRIEHNFDFATRISDYAAHDAKGTNKSHIELNGICHRSSLCLKGRHHQITSDIRIEINEEEDEEEKPLQ